MTQYMQVGDVARELGVTPDAIRKAANEGRLAMAAETRGGVRLFTSDAVEAYRAARKARREQTANHSA